MFGLLQHRIIFDLFFHSEQILGSINKVLMDVVAVVVSILIFILYYFLIAHYVTSPVDRPTVMHDVVDLENNRLDKNFRHIEKLDPKVRYDSVRTYQYSPFDFTFLKMDESTMILQTTHSQWNIELPPRFVWRDDRIEKVDACYGQPNDWNVKAERSDLYYYVLDHNLYPQHFKNNKQNGIAQHFLFENHIYFFKCVDDRISQLYYCDNGSQFDEKQCTEFNICQFKEDGFKFKAEGDPKHYFECKGGKRSLVKTCPTHQKFIKGQCREVICFEREDGYVISIDSKTYIVCINEMPKTGVCKEFQQFIENRCVDKLCIDTLDSVKIAYKRERVEHLEFSPGFIECQDGKDIQKVICTLQERDDEDQTDLAFLNYKVFHEGFCENPSLCRNVLSTDSSKRIPQYTWRKQFPQSDAAYIRDCLGGWYCTQEGEKKLFQIQNQYIIDPTTNNLVDRCAQDTTVDFLPVYDWKQYFSCTQKALLSCPVKYYFNITHSTCKPIIEDGHTFEGLPIMKFNNLQNNWFRERHYLKTPVNKTTCTKEEMYLQHYDICADKTCVKYPFLKEIKRHVFVDNEYACVFENGKIVRKKHSFHVVEPYRLDYWRQKFSKKIVEPCVENQKIQSQNFMLDSSLYATCDNNQPFVFCPSSGTDRIEKVGEKWMCVPNRNVVSLFVTHLESGRHRLTNVDRIEGSADTTFKFKKKTDTDITELVFEDDGGRYKLSNEDLQKVIARNVQIEVNKPITVYERMVSNPLSHFIKIKNADMEIDLQYYGEDFVYLIRLDGATDKDIAVDSYDVADYVDDFIMLQGDDQADDFVENDDGDPVP